METRKVQITGGSTYTVSLPKDWADRNRLNQGDPLFIEAEQDSLTISCEGGEEKRSVEIDASEREALDKRIIAAYINGYSVMTIRSSGSDKEAAKSVVNKLMGTEIIEESAEHIVVEDLLDPFQLDSEKGLKRMHLMARRMHRDGVRSFGDQELATDIVKRDDEVDRLYLLISRQFSLLDGKGVEQHFGTLMCARALERIADHAYKIAQNASVCDASKEVQEVLRDLSDETLDLVDSAVSSFHTDDAAEANSVFDRRAGLESREAEAQKLILEEPTEAAVHEHTILDSIGRSADYATDVAESSINSSF